MTKITKFFKCSRLPRLIEILNLNKHHWMKKPLIKFRILKIIPRFLQMQKRNTKLWKTSWSQSWTRRLRQLILTPKLWTMQIEEKRTKVILMPVIMKSHIHFSVISRAVQGDFSISNNWVAMCPKLIPKKVKNTPQKWWKETKDKQNVTFTKKRSNYSSNQIQNQIRKAFT